jgi:hypothetical protein
MDTSASSKRPLRSQSSIDEDKEETEEASLSRLSSREAGVASTARGMPSHRNNNASASPAPRGRGIGLAKSLSFSSTMSPTAGFVRRYCFFGILLSLGLLLVHLAETSSMLERSMLVLTGTTTTTPSSEDISSASSSRSSSHTRHEKAPSRDTKVEIKRRPKKLRSARSESADGQDETQCKQEECP